MNDSFIISFVARTRPLGRLDEIVQTAARVFADQGYKRTQMADVARALGVAAGTLYNYVEGKDALFDLCLQRAFVSDPPPLPEKLPVPTPDPGRVAEHVRETLARAGGTPKLVEALRHKEVDDPASELSDLVLELYAFLADNADGIRLLERSAADRPDLAAIYFRRARGGLIERWRRYLEIRIEAGAFCRVPDLETAARLVIESVAWFAWHRHGDPEPGPYDDESAAATIVHFTRRALVREDR
jgi:AcrR family transcriptional regulator